MGLTPGAHIGPYEVTALIGEGGMGKVWRAHHTALKRDDALKVLPDAFASDPDRLARFQREAQILASLNHPNIAHVYGLEQTDGVQALVMELVEGETLADRIARGPIPLDEALPIARHIAEALEAAHEQGIIHRDLKPANIKLRPDGTVKVLDFGLAKALEPQPAAIDASQSPTIGSPTMMSGVGVLLGTAAYMSPEQAKGRAADKRSDIWAFACVLYEMLTGKRAFAGDDVSETLASVLAREPDWSALRNVPQAVRSLLRRCLQKDRRKRVSDIAVALFVLDAADSASFGTAEHAVASVRRLRWHHLAVYAPAALALAAIGGGAVWYAMRPASPRVAQLAIVTTPASALTINGNDRDIAITPDGSRVIYVGNNGTELFVRSIDAIEPLSLFKGAPRGPFVSPDSQWVGFFDNTTILKKIPITGGPPVTITTLDGGSRGAAWMADDTIIFATLSPTGLQEVPAGGGTSTVVTRPDRAHDELDHAWPRVLPGGKAVTFTIFPTSGGVGQTQVAIFNVQTGMSRVVVRGGSDAHYVRSGHLVYAAGSSLHAVAFDLTTLETRGTSVPVVSQALITTGVLPGGVDAESAADGTLTYVRGTTSGGGARTLAWVDRQGRETPVAAPPRLYIHPRLRPGGSDLVVASLDQESDLWLWSVSRSTLTRLTFVPGLDGYPVWTPDGSRLIFASLRDGPMNVFWQAADGTGAVQRLTTSPNQQLPTAISPDGTRVVFTETSPTTGEDILQVDLRDTRAVTPLVQTAFAERNGTVSPDGRWLAYETNASGQTEIYVRPYPTVSSGLWQVSTNGGTRPLWSGTGQELFFLSSAGAIMRVGVEPSTSWAATTPGAIVKEGLVAGLNATPGRIYDVSSDAQRFLMLKDASDPNAPPPQLIVVQHFDEMLKRLVPTK